MIDDLDRARTHHTARRALDALLDGDDAGTARDTLTAHLTPTEVAAAAHGFAARARDLVDMLTARAVEHPDPRQAASYAVIVAGMVATALDLLNVDRDDLTARLDEREAQHAAAAVEHGLAQLYRDGHL